MGYKVTVNDPARPKGDGIEVPGLGVFKNKETTEISDERADYYRDIRSEIVDVETDDRPAITGAADTELRRGPELLEAFKGHPTVKVAKIGEKPAAGRKES